MVVLIIISASAGFNFISESNIQRHEVPCKLLDVIVFTCDYASSINKYHSVTSMVLLISNTNVTITMADNCISCFDCKNLYTIGTTYNCALTDNKYTIYDCNHTSDYGLVIIGILFLLFSTFFVIILTVALISLRSRLNKHLDQIDA